MIVGIMHVEKPSRAWVLLPPALYVINCLWHWPFFMDDAFIFLRYAQHIAAGQGYGFNAHQPIEGTTSLLWTLLAAGWTAVGRTGPLTLKLMGVAAGAVCVIGVTVCRLTPAAFFARVIAACALALYVPFALLGVSGMETTLGAALLLFGLHYLFSAEKNGRVTGVVLLSLAFLTRPDLGLFFMAIPLSLAVRLPKDGGPRWRREWYLVALPVAVVLTVTAWRWWTFHDLAPNPARLKAAGVSGAQLRAGLVLAGHWLLDQALLIPLLLAGAAVARKSARALATAIPLAAFLLYVCSLGRPEMGLFYRFYIPVTPLIFALAAGGLTSLAAREHRLYAVAGIAAMSLMIVLLLPAHQRHWRGSMDRFGLAASAAEYGRAMTVVYPAFGRMLDATLPADATIALLDAGAIPYYAKRTTHDLYGLNDRRIVDIFRAAHRDRDPRAQLNYYRLYLEEIISRWPDYFVDTYLPRALVGDPRFRDCYRLEKLPRRYWANERLGAEIRLYRRICP